MNVAVYSLRAHFLCGIITSMPLRKNVSVLQDAYLKPRQRKRRRTVGKRRDRNAVRTLDETADGISGTFTHQVNQTGKRQIISLSHTHQQLCVCVVFLTPADTLITRCSLSMLNSYLVMDSVKYRLGCGSAVFASPIIFLHLWL